MDRFTNLVLDEQALKVIAKQLGNRLIISTVRLQGRRALAIPRARSSAVDVHGAVSREDKPGRLGAVYASKVVFDERVLRRSERDSRHKRAIKGW